MYSKNTPPRDNNWFLGRIDEIFEISIMKLFHGEIFLIFMHRQFLSLFDGYDICISVHETISTDSVKEKGASGDLYLIDDHQSEELDRASRQYQYWYCKTCKCCKNG